MYMRSSRGDRNPAEDWACPRARSTACPATHGVFFVFRPTKAPLVCYDQGLVFPAIYSRRRLVLAAFCRVSVGFLGRSNCWCRHRARQTPLPYTSSHTSFLLRGRSIQLEQLKTGNSQNLRRSFLCDTPALEQQTKASPRNPHRQMN